LVYVAERSGMVLPRSATVATPERLSQAMTGDPDAAFLGKILRRARVAAGIRSAEELASEWGYERTVIAKAESGQRPPTPEVARKYAERFPQLNALVESGLIEEWAEHVKSNGGGGSFPKNFGKWVDQEQNAANLFYWAPILVPGMFQTPGYARAILATTPSDEPLDDRLADRLSRQDILNRSQSPVVSVIMAEAVLRRCVGGADVMHEQLTYLAEIPYQRVMIQVIPAEIGSHAGLEGAASIADRDDGRTIVHLESLTDAQTTGEPETLARVREITGMLRSEALSRTASRELMAKVAEEEWKAQS
jgi:transcriptional regulator with XRE-family HTH domain